MRAGDVVLIEGPDVPPSNTRQWLEETHDQLASRLPWPGTPALLTADMVDAEHLATNVQHHFGRRAEDQDTLLWNLEGLRHTASCACTRFYIDEPPPALPGFQDVWIPVKTADFELELGGRLGLARDPHTAQVLQADCIVLLPGLFGDNGVLRSRDLAAALRQQGKHVLSLELRGCGQTERRFPQVPSSWGVLGTIDLLTVARWLQARPEVNRTGLLGFCWGANIALLTSWADGRSSGHPSVTPAIAASFGPQPGERCFEAGVMAFSPVLQFEDLIDQLDEPRKAWKAPVLNAMQGTVKFRVERKGYECSTHSLRELVWHETGRCKFDSPEPTVDGLTYLRLTEYKDSPAGDKLEDARVPVLLIQAANDPLNNPQALADLVAQTANAHVAAIILPGGGHVGFPAYARSYYFSLIMNFFDPQKGPAASRADRSFDLE